MGGNLSHRAININGARKNIQRANICRRKCVWAAPRLANDTRHCFVNLAHVHPRLLRTTRQSINYCRAYFTFGIGAIISHSSRTMSNCFSQSMHTSAEDCLIENCCRSRLRLRPIVFFFLVAIQQLSAVARNWCVSFEQLKSIACREVGEYLRRKLRYSESGGTTRSFEWYSSPEQLIFLGIRVGPVTEHAIRESIAEPFPNVLHHWKLLKTVLNASTHRNGKQSHWTRSAHFNFLNH